jgi:hypothetical protein
MARKPITDMSAWPSLTLEGNLIAPAMVASIDRSQAPEQTEEHYRVRKGLTIREEISTAFRVGQSHFDAFAKLQNPSVEATRRFVRGFLAETFGFDDLAVADGMISFLAGGRVPIVVAPPSDEKLDRRSPTLSVERSRSPALALQDYLNDSEQALWGLVTNGSVIRLMRDNASLTRPAYVEADLAQIFANEDAASFAVLWSLIHRTRFGAAGAPVTDCALERWREAGSRVGEAARDRLAAQVEIALKVLGSGFLEANPDLATRLKSGEVNLTEWFNELLRLIYRLIFLMVAEDRNLLHPETAQPAARKLYVEGYSLAALRAQCVRAATWDKYHDRYEGIKIVFRALAHGQPALGLPALGGLFGAGMLPHLETARLRNRAFMEALYRLAWLKEKTGMVPVNWRAMETEELGSVYESLLELQPQLGDDGKTLRFASETAEQKGNQRKTTGSYYTPDSLVQALLDTALDPVLEKTEAESDDPAAALLKLSVIDPACGSGHFLLAAARRIATRVARIRADGTPALSDFRHALRDVARSCLHGVDRNPMAVELTKVALWIETVDPGLPLGFFDAQIRCGDSLLGVFDLKTLERGIPDAAYKPLTGDDKPTAKYFSLRNRTEQIGQSDFFSRGGNLPTATPLAQARAALRALPEATVEQIEDKRRRFEAARADRLNYAWGEAADLYIAAFLLPKTGGPPVIGQAPMVPTTGDVWRALADRQVHPPLVARATEIAQSARAFHWPLEFPDVMASGGFDVVLGNPPWDVVQLSDKEFFSVTEPALAKLKGARRKGVIDLLQVTNPKLHTDYVIAKRLIDAANAFARDSGRFDLSARGKINLYGLFAELSLCLIKESGRVGAILPAGIATDYFNRAFFDHCMLQKKLISFLMFDNQKRIFPAVHPDTPFGILALGSSAERVEFASYLLQEDHLYDSRRRYFMTRETVEVVNPNTRTAPIFRSVFDAELTAKIYSGAPVLINESSGEKGNIFGVEVIQNFFSTSSERDQNFIVYYDDAQENPDGLWPVYRGSMVYQFDAFNATYVAEDESFREITEADRQSMTVVLEADKYVPEVEVRRRLAEKGWHQQWLLGWRDITNATNERTVISAVFPISASDDTLSLLLPTMGAPLNAALILAALNSLVLDYVAQQKVSGTHVRKYVISQLPIFKPDYYTEPRLAFITPKVLELTYTSHSLAPFAHDLGYNGAPFGWNEERRAGLRADLDAFYARAYGLTRDELRYILDPAEVKGADYPSETFRVLKEKEIRQHGEYRTQRLVLAAWDRMEAEGTFRALGLADVALTSVAHVAVELPPLDDVRSGAWTWPTTVQPRDRLRYSAQYVLWLTNPADDAGRIRFLIACLAEPAMLTAVLTGSERSQWIRLVGPEAQPAQGVVRLRPAINEAWRSMFETMLTSGQLTEAADGGWARGEHFDPAGLQTQSADAQRAAFALHAVRELDFGALTAAVAQEDNVVWARFRRAG